MVMSTELWNQVADNIKSEHESTAQFQWQRACLYYSLSKEYPTQKAFLEEIDEKSAGGFSDSATVVKGMIAAVGMLAQAEFLGLGLEKAKLLAQKSLKEKFNHPWTVLVRIAHEMSKREVQAAIKAIKANNWDYELPPRPLTKDEQVRALLTDMAKHHPQSVLAHFGIANPPKNKRELDVLVRPLSQQMHPDKGGDPELFQIFYDAYKNYLEICKLSGQLTEKYTKPE